MHSEIGVWWVHFAFALDTMKAVDCLLCGCLVRAAPKTCPDFSILCSRRPGLVEVLMGWADRICTQGNVGGVNIPWQSS